MLLLCCTGPAEAPSPTPSPTLSPTLSPTPSPTPPASIQNFTISPDCIRAALATDNRESRDLTALALYTAGMILINVTEGGNPYGIPLGGLLETGPLHITGLLQLFRGVGSGLLAPGWNLEKDGAELVAILVGSKRYPDASWSFGTLPGIPSAKASAVCFRVCFRVLSAPKLLSGRSGQTCS